MAKAKQPTVTIAVPADSEDAGALLSRLGQKSASEAELEARKARLIDRITERYNKRIAALQLDIAAAAKALQKFADKNRDMLCHPAGSKTIKLPTGELYWKTGDEAVETAEGVKPAAMIEALIAGGHTDCLKLKPKLDKIAIKANWPELTETRLAGLRLVKREFFYLLPTGMTEALQMKTKAVEVIDELDGKPKPKKGDQ